MKKNMKDSMTSLSLIRIYLKNLMRNLSNYRLNGKNKLMQHRVTKSGKTVTQKTLKMMR